MAGLGWQLESVGWRAHVHPAFIAAVAAKESSLGVAACPGNRFNVWGLGSCGSAWTPPTFRSWHGAIVYFARFIRRTWPHARTPWELYGYAADVQGSWAPGVAGWMRSWGFPAVVGYGR
jgi:hypothetical protein